MNSPKMQNAENFQRSAMAPVGMVAAVSMNTTSNRNSRNMPVSYEGPLRAKPFPPKMPQPPMATSLFRMAAPPNPFRAPMPPNISPNPST